MTVQIRQADPAGAALVPRADGASRCGHCPWRPLCLPSGLNEAELQKLEAAFGPPRRVARGDTLFRAGQRFNSLYAIRFGHFLTSRIDYRGARYVTGLQMAGDLLGMDGIGDGEHVGTAVALEDSEVCDMPYARLQELMGALPQVMAHFHRIMARQLTWDQAATRCLGVQRADGRLAALLLNLAARYAMRGYSPRRFYLRMSRDDIACALGLQIETVSRLLTRFREDGLIQLDRRDLEILDVAALEALAS